jgi:hypothetical protein
MAEALKLQRDFERYEEDLAEQRDKYATSMLEKNMIMEDLHRRISGVS